MKNIFKISLILLVITFCSCGDSIKGSLDKQLSGANMVKIYFYDKNGKLTGKENIITIEDKEIISKLVQAISDDTAPDYKCGYTGSMEYFKAGKSVLNTEFNVMPECSHIIFQIKANMYSKKLTPESVLIINKYYEMIDSRNKASLN